MQRAVSGSPDDRSRAAEVSLYPALSAAENLEFFGRIYGVTGVELGKRIDELLALVGLDTHRDDQVSIFSGGMKRRLNLAVSLVHRPKLILLDEPTAGVDPQSREQILKIIGGLRDDGNAILYTTHYMEEAERLCDRLGILSEGKLVAVGTLDTLLSGLEFPEIIEVRGLPAEIDLAGMHALGGVSRVERDDCPSARSWRSGGRITGGQTSVAHHEACATPCSETDPVGSAGARSLCVFHVTQTFPQDGCDTEGFHASVLSPRPGQAQVSPAL